MIYEIFSYKRNRILNVGDTIKDGEGLGFAFVDSEGRKTLAHSFYLSYVVYKNYKRISKNIRL